MAAGAGGVPGLGTRPLSQRLQGLGLHGTRAGDMGAGLELRVVTWALVVVWPLPLPLVSVSPLCCEGHHS
jgi:hypothetical protein